MKRQVWDPGWSFSTQTECDKGTPYSQIVKASNVWAVITETVRNPIFVESHQMLLINQRCRPSIKCQMCFFFPRCLWMLIDAAIGVDQHSHTHTHPLSLSVSLLPCFLSPPFLTLYKLVLWLCVYQLKYRFHCIWLFSFPRVTINESQCQESWYCLGNFKLRGYQDLVVQFLGAFLLWKDLYWTFYTHTKSQCQDAL